MFGVGKSVFADGVEFVCFLGVEGEGREAKKKGHCLITVSFLCAEIYERNIMFQELYQRLLYKLLKLFHRIFQQQ